MILSISRILFSDLYSFLLHNPEHTHYAHSPQLQFIYCSTPFISYRRNLFADIQLASLLRVNSFCRWTIPIR